MRCNLGAKCHKEDPRHKREFAHPKDDDWDTATEPPKAATWSCGKCSTESAESFKFCSKCMTPQPAGAVAAAEAEAAAEAAAVPLTKAMLAVEQQNAAHNSGSTSIGEKNCVPRPRQCNTKQRIHVK